MEMDKGGVCEMERGYALILNSGWNVLPCSERRNSDTAPASSSTDFLTDHAQSAAPAPGTLASAARRTARVALERVAGSQRAWAQ